LPEVNGHVSANDPAFFKMLNVMFSQASAPQGLHRPS
jgi:hypothetical protein